MKVVRGCGWWLVALNVDIVGICGGELDDDVLLTDGEVVGQGSDTVSLTPNEQRGRGGGREIERERERERGGECGLVILYSRSSKVLKPNRR